MNNLPAPGNSLLSSQQQQQPQHDSFCTCFGGGNILICKKSWREFEELPLAEQQQVWADLSGDSKPAAAAPPARQNYPDEEPFPASIKLSLHSLPPGGEAAVVERSIENLREELYRMQLQHHDHNSRTDASIAALMLVLQQSPGYVTDPAFLLKFLRSEHFDVPAASKRLARHFHEKSLLFPAEALGRDIRYEDLSKNDVDALERGYLQVLRKLDHIGRRTLFYYKALSNCYIERENILRTYWYMTQALSNDVDVQKRGVVHVVYNHAYPKGGMDFEKSRRLARLFQAVPIRFPTFWVCLIGTNNNRRVGISSNPNPNPTAYPAHVTDEEDGGEEGAENDVKPWWTVVDTFSVMINKLLSIRLRVLVGSRQECMYQLLELGIPQQSIPTNDQNRLKLKYHRRWIQEQRRIEQEKQQAATARQQQLDQEVQLQQQLQLEQPRQAFQQQAPAPPPLPQRVRAPPPAASSAVAA